MRFLDEGLTLVRSGRSMQEAADTIVEECASEKEVPPGFGHRFHTRDPRAGRLFQMALELELEGEHVRMLRAAERAVEARVEQFGRALPVNVDGAIAAICADLGFALRARQRHFPDLASARASSRTRTRSGRGTRRCGSSIRRTTTTTARASGGCQRAGSSPPISRPFPLPSSRLQGSPCHSRESGRIPLQPVECTPRRCSPTERCVASAWSCARRRRQNAIRIGAWLDPAAFRSRTTARSERRESTRPVALGPVAELYPESHRRMGRPAGMSPGDRASLRCRSESSMRMPDSHPPPSNVPAPARCPSSI